jgi:hypothetical protein
MRRLEMIIVLCVLATIGADDAPPPQPKSVAALAAIHKADAAGHSKGSGVFDADSYSWIHDLASVAPAG